jgi:hypothetical protein
MSKTTTKVVTITEQISKPFESNGKWSYTNLSDEGEGWSYCFDTYEEACADIMKWIFADGATQMTAIYDVHY